MQEVQLPPPGAAAAGLSPAFWDALHDRAQASSQAAGLALDWHSSAPAQGLPPPGERAGEAVEAIFEAMLREAARAAGARRMAVHLALDQGLLRLTVRHDGRGDGGEASAVPGGGALAGMQALADRCAGRVVLTTRPGHGCVITLVLPLSEPWAG